MPLTSPTNTSEDGIWEGWDHDAKLVTDVKPAELWDLPERTTSATGWANFVNPPSGLTRKRQKSPWDAVTEDDQLASVRLQPEETSPMRFEVMYYGVCPDVGLAPTDSAGMPQIDAQKTLQAKRAEEQRDGKRTCYRSRIFFSKKGVYVADSQTEDTLVSWTTNEVILMTTTKASNTGWWDEYWNGTERVALLKVFTPDRKLEWHVFKYAKLEIDNMLEAFNELFREIPKAMAPLTPTDNVPIKSVRKLQLEWGDN